MSKLKTFKALIKFIISQKKFWLLPIVVVLVILTSLILFSENSVIGPFIYSLF
ncbi:DUF5989 family protein [Winogradskyella sp.]|uniref:DUF5989 family protein n=1 Tax=Winogradskyella sp. TaxID=1883156 RepID=UPI0025F27229|nr:DUF5989 family protein [Winogradskyella sp.]